MFDTAGKVQDVKVAFPKRRQLSMRRNEPQLWPFEAALAAGFAVAVLGLIALTWLALAATAPPLAPSSRDDLAARHDKRPAAGIRFGGRLGRPGRADRFLPEAENR